MFASNSNNNDDPDLPFPYINQTEYQFGNTLTTIFEIPTSKQEIVNTSSFSQYPDPFLDDGELVFSHLLYHQDLFVSSTSQAQINTTSSKAPNTKKDITSLKSTKEAKKDVSRKKSTQSTGDQLLIARKQRMGKNDRYSKIFTAQGPRDRRMRLSLQIARKFFDLQDMLGFDTASKTIEWLFAKSKTAIKELMEKYSAEVKHNHKNGGNASENEVLSEKIKIRKLHTVARESRDKARDRARERTREKLIIRGLEKSKLNTEAKPGELRDDKFCFQREEMNYCFKNRSVEGEMNSVSIGEKILGNHYQNVEVPREPTCDNDFSGFLMNWNSNDSIIQCRTTTDMKPSSGKKASLEPCSFPAGDQNVPELDEIDPIIFNVGCSKSNTKQQAPCLSDFFWFGMHSMEEASLSSLPV